MSLHCQSCPGHPGAERDGACSTRGSSTSRSTAPVPGRGRGAAGDVGADDLPRRRRAFDAGRMSIGTDPGQARHRRGGACRRTPQGDAPAHVVGGGPAGGGGRDLRRAQGHPHRHRHRAFRRAGAGHHGDREFPLRQVQRGPRSWPRRWRQHVRTLRRGRGHRAARKDLQPAGGRVAWSAWNSKAGATLRAHRDPRARRAGGRPASRRTPTATRA